MTRTMYDGVAALAAGIARDFPNAEMIAYYLAGPNMWTPAEIALFPRAEHVTIVPMAINAGDVLDVEPGDAGPQQTAGWIQMRKANGLYRPTIYCSLSVVPAVRIGTGRWRLGIDYDIWVADWDGNPSSLPAGVTLAAAKQFKNTPGYDVTTVFNPLWPVRQPPPAKVTLTSVTIDATFSDGTKRAVSFP